MTGGIEQSINMLNIIPQQGGAVEFSILLRGLFPSIGDR